MQLMYYIELYCTVGERETSSDYTSKDLKGMKIGHSLDSFTQGCANIVITIYGHTITSLINELCFKKYIFP